MPRLFDRHSRPGTWDYSSQPSRSDLVRLAARDDPEPAPQRGRRKQTRDWCKGKKGVPHTPVIELEPSYVSSKGCRWSAWVAGKLDWHCEHREVCSTCGKILAYSWQLTRTRCPAYPGDPQQKEAALRRLAEEQARRREQGRRWYRPRPRITGPQGYRRPKAGGTPPS